MNGAAVSTAPSQQEVLIVGTLAPSLIGNTKLLMGVNLKFWRVVQFFTKPH